MINASEANKIKNKANTKINNTKQKEEELIRKENPMY